MTETHTGEYYLKQAHRLVAKSGAVLATQLVKKKVLRNDLMVVTNGLEAATRILKELIASAKPVR